MFTQKETPLARAPQDVVEADESASLAMLGIAAAFLLHRINNELGLLGMRADRLRSLIGSTNSEALTYITGIERTAKNLAGLTRALEVLKRGAAPERLDINSLLYEVWENLANDGKCDAAQIDWDFDPEVIPEIGANRGLLAEAFRLVLENALEANEHQNCLLRICTRHIVDDSEIVVEIEDNGKGIPPQVLERLFIQPVASTKDDPARMGHGTGLWLVSLILTRLRGSIQILRTGFGQGTIVQITLPVTS